mgnify:CR=1 FL=1
MQGILGIEPSHEAVPRRQRVHPHKHGAVRRQVLVGQGMTHRHRTQGSGHPQGEEGPGLRGDEQGPLVHRPDQWLHPKAVSGAHQAAASGVGHREGKFTAKLVHQGIAVHRVQGWQQSAIAASGVFTQGTERSGLGPPSIQLTVEHRRACATGSDRWLGIVGPCHDSEPGVAQV